MREEQYMKFLLKDESINSKDKAVRSRISRARKVERELKINLDHVVCNDDAMFETLLMIKEKLKDKGNLQNTVRKYYTFVNNKEFPSLLRYKRTTKVN
ncbi:hypothetical protein ACVBAX_13330 [Robertmurraya sp. GLU-23]